MQSYTHTKHIQMSDNCCYICYDDHSEQNPLMDTNPCKCNFGKMHYTCFETIRRQRKCPTCGDQFPLKPVIPDYMISHEEDNLLTCWMEDHSKRKHGPYFEFTMNHDMYVITRQGYYNHGLKESIWYIWSLDGKLIMETNYLNNYHYGTQKRFDKDGHVITWTVGLNTTVLPNVYRIH